jgi:hypothetical protein
MKYSFALMFWMVWLISSAQITHFSPTSGAVGSSVTIYGSGFSTITLNNTVFFGGIKADILNATENALMATVPYGAYYTPISVYTNGLYATSSQRFNVTFDATEELTVAHLSNQLDNPYLGRKYYDIKIADMNGDNVAEIVTSEAGYGSSAYLAIFTTSFDDDGMISIDQHIEFNFGTGVYSVPQDIALGDLNGDGLLDVVTSEQGDVTDDFEAHTCIFINSSENQNFSFESPIIIDGDGYESCVQLQDINGDGKLDVVTTRGTSDQLGIYVNTSDGNSVSFADKIIISNVFANGRPDFADLNGDGMIDMVTASYSSSSYSNREVFVYSNNSAEGNIEFDLEATIVAGGFPPAGYNDYNWSSSNPTLADIDGDGRLDIIVGNGTCGLCSPSGISILRNISTDSELGFEYEYSDFYQYESNSLPVGISISDLNGDGKPDLLTNDWMGGISIMVNSSTEGNISLEEQMQIGVGGFPLSIATADLNMDFTPEIVVSNWEVEGLRIIHNFIPSMQPVVSNCTDSLEVTDVIIDNTNSTMNIAIYNGYNLFLHDPYVAYTIDATGDTIQQGNPNLFGAINLDTTWYNYSLSSDITPAYPLTIYFVYHVPPSDWDTCILTYNSAPTAITDINISSNRKLIGIFDVLGRQNKGIKNELLFYIYDDGTVEKKIILE